MNDLAELLESITPEIYANLKRAIELGKWPNGQRLEKEQTELCMQAVISYEHQHLSAEQHTGFIPAKPHKHCDETTSNTGRPVKWVTDKQ